VRHGGLHADAEDVELEQTQVLHVVLVELAHRVAAQGAFGGRPVAEGGIGEDDSARVQGDVPGQPVEALHEGEQHLQLGVVQVGAAQFGQFAQGVADVTGADVREGLGDGVDVAGRQAHGGADVADGVPDAVGVEHGHGGDPLLPEVGEHLVVDLEAAGGLHVDVDVGQRPAQRGEEPLHDQVVADRVDPRDAQAVVDQAAGPRAAGGDPDAQVFHPCDHVGDGEEVGREPHLGDDGQLVVQPIGRLAARRAVAGVQSGLAAGAERGERVADAAEHGELGQVDLAQADVGMRVEAAPQGQRTGVAQQPGRVAASGEPGHVCGARRHLGPGGEVALGVAAVDVAGIQRHQPAGGVQHVGDRRIRFAGHAHRVGEDAGKAVRVGEGEHATGQPRRPRTGPGEPVVGDADDELVGVDAFAPGRQHPRCAGLVAGGDRLAQV
jgi:hypothetical protein